MFAATATVAKLGTQCVNDETNAVYTEAHAKINNICVNYSHLLKL